MNIATESFDDSIVMIPDENITSQSFQVFCQQAKALLSEFDCAQVLLDLKLVEFIDSSGLGAIISLFKTIKEKNKDFLLITSNEQILKLLEVTKLDQVIAVQPGA